MNRRFVTSSNLLSVGYDASSHTLEVEFKNGSIYQYYGISQAIYRGLLNAPSHGRYLHYFIKPYYPYSRIA